MDIEKSIEDEFEKLRLEIIQAYDAKGMRASGKFANTSEVKTSKSTGGVSGKLIGESYVEQLESGRSSGRFPPLKEIEEWILNKGVFNSALTTIKLSSLAFIIARKIANSGWNRQRFGGVDLISSVVTPERVQKIIDAVGEVALINVSSDIEGLFRELEVE